MSQSSRADIMSGVVACVSQSLGAEESSIKPSTSLIEDLGADSLDILDLMFHLEEKFGIKLEKSDFNFLEKIEMKREEAVKDELLTDLAKEKLSALLPELDASKDIRPADLSAYLSVSALARLVEVKQKA